MANPMPYPTTIEEAKEMAEAVVADGVTVDDVPNADIWGNTIRNIRANNNFGAGDALWDAGNNLGNEANTTRWNTLITALRNS